MLLSYKLWIYLSNNVHKAMYLKGLGSLWTKDCVNQNRKTRKLRKQTVNEICRKKGENQAQIKCEVKIYKLCDP